MQSKYDRVRHNSVYGCPKPFSPSKLPTTHTHTVGGRRYSKAPELRDEVFGAAIRHYGVEITAVSARTLSIREGPLRLEIEGAILLACGDNSIWNREEVPVPCAGRSFFLPRSINLFPGGERQKLGPGVYQTNDSITDQHTGRVYLELTSICDKGSEDFVAVVGNFRPGKVPQCIDWRAIEPISPCLLPCGIKPD